MGCVAHCRRMLALLSALELVKWMRGRRQGIDHDQERHFADGTESRNGPTGSREGDGMGGANGTARWVEVESGTEKPTGWFINGETNCKPVWAPSTDVEAAIRAMEELRRRGYDVSIEKEGLAWTIELQGEDYYSVASSEGSTRMIHLRHHQGPRYVALGKSFQEAICRVALLAAMDADEG